MTDQTPTPAVFQAALAQAQRLLAAEQRLHLAREALLNTGHWTPDQIGDDLAPRITELANQPHPHGYVEDHEWTLVPKHSTCILLIEHHGTGTGTTTRLDDTADPGSTGTWVPHLTDIQRPVWAARLRAWATRIENP